MLQIEGITGKAVVITGASSGLGAVTARRISSASKLTFWAPRK